MKKFLARFVRQSPALVVAMVALFVALTGTAVATTSALITGKQIKNNSITGLDIKNKSIAIGDLATRARGARGVRGVAGPPGPVGPVGPAGAPNPNAANSELLDGLDSTQFQKVPTDVQHFTIPGTDWMDTDSAGRALVQVGGNGVPGAYCTRTGGDRMHAAIHLPQGATITGVTVDYLDDSATTASDGFGWMTRTTFAGRGGTWEDLFNISLPNTPVAGAFAGVNGTATGPADRRVVDNSKYAYTMIMDAAGTAAICNVDVAYTVAPGFAAAAVERAAAGAESGS